MQDFIISIIGTGAIGGYYGGLLSKSGKDVHFLLKSDYEHVLKNGLVVDSPLGSFHLPSVPCALTIEELPLSDLLIVSAKTTQNTGIYSSLGPLLKPDGIVLLLQNGLGLEEELEAFIEPQKIFGGTCFICSNKIGPGHIEHQDYGLVKLGQYKPPAGTEHPGPALQKLASLFENSQIQVQVMENLLLERWKKLVWNIPYNGLCALEGLPTDGIMSQNRHRRRIEILMDEVLAMSKVCGYAIESSFTGKMLEATDKMISYRPSMLLDSKRGNPLELESMYAVPLQQARKAGYHAVEVERLYTELKEAQDKGLLLDSSRRK